MGDNEGVPSRAGRGGGSDPGGVGPPPADHLYKHPENPANPVKQGPKQWTVGWPTVQRRGGTGPGEAGQGLEPQVDACREAVDGLDCSHPTRPPAPVPPLPQVVLHPLHPRGFHVPSPPAPQCPAEVGGRQPVVPSRWSPGDRFANPRVRFCHFSEIRQTTPVPPLRSTSGGREVLVGVRW